MILDPIWFAYGNKYEEKNICESERPEQIGFPSGGHSTSAPIVGDVNTIF